MCGRRRTGSSWCETAYLSLSLAPLSSLSQLSRPAYATSRSNGHVSSQRRRTYTWIPFALTVLKLSLCRLTLPPTPRVVPHSSQSPAASVSCGTQISITTGSAFVSPHDTVVTGHLASGRPARHAQVWKRKCEATIRIVRAMLAWSISVASPSLSQTTQAPITQARVAVKYDTAVGRRSC